MCGYRKGRVESEEGDMPVSIFNSVDWLCLLSREEMISHVAKQFRSEHDDLHSSRVDEEAAFCSILLFLIHSFQQMSMGPTSCQL